jgi:hypothetical protein
VPARALLGARGAAALAPLWAGLSASLSAVLPFVGLLLLPLGGARLARTARAQPGTIRPLLVCALAVPAAFLISTFALSVGTGLLAAFLAFAFIGLPAAAIAAGARDGRRRDRVMLLVAATSGIGALGGILVAALGTGHDPGWLLSTKLGQATPDILAFYKNAGWSESSIEAVARGMTFTRAAIASYLPGLLLAGCVLHAALVVYAFGGAALPEPELTEVPFSRFSTPLAAAALFVPAGLLAAIGPHGAVPAAVDLLLPLLALFFLRGLAIIRALLDRGRAGFLGRAIVYTFVLQMPIPVLLALGGLFDEFLDVRGRLERRDRERTLRSNE